MNVYRIKVEQFARNGFLQKDDRFDVPARTMPEAIKRVVTHCRRSTGWLKSRPIDIVSVERVCVDLL